MKERAQVKKCIAELLVRRLFAEWVIKGSCIRRLDIKAVNLSAPRIAPKPKPSWCARGYEHHIEPRLETLTIATSPWMRYLQGYEYE